MEREELRPLEPRRPDAGYDSQGQLIQDLSAWVDLLLYQYYAHHQWLGPDSSLKNMLGLVVSREEFEHNLTRAAQRGLWTQQTAEEQEDAMAVLEAIGARIEKTWAELPLLELMDRFDLDDFAFCCVVLAYLPHVDRKYERLYAYLQDDMTRKCPDTALAVQLFLPWGETPEGYLARFAGQGGFLRLFKPDKLAQGSLDLQDVAVEYLCAGSIASRPGLRLFDGTKESPEAPLAIQQETARRLDRAMAGQEPCTVLLTGPAGVGKKFQVAHLMARKGLRCVFADLEGEEWAQRAEEAALAADLTGACLCLYHLDRQEGAESRPPDGAMMDRLGRTEFLQGKRFFLSMERGPARLQGLTVELELPMPSEQERLELFRSALAGVELAEDCTLEELAAKFRFSPRQIAAACAQAVGLAGLEGGGPVQRRLLHQCCHQQAVHRLGELASRVPPAYSWEDVVLPEEQKRLMQQACGHIRYQHQVYYGWGFDKKVRYGRGLSILFAGAPGTGKTMCAQVIANQLDMELYKINLSQIVSKYIGETEKNLRAVFQEARHAGCILFFDECDALFGKRSEVKDAHDRNANVEVAYLLQQLEEHDGVCILATNLLGNIDAAFMRRITYVVRFPFPEPPMREAIYRRMLPPAAPVADDIDWAFLAEKFRLSGGHIKNIVLAAAFLAAGSGQPISMRHLLRAAVDELKKNDIVVVREELKEYADLLDT
ncbi:ATP-binding protein [Faecalibacterium sp. An58]|uniref:ATP-binding protein n=1 Tax=Faecalibacterium sp. An58 TaxID=1965648 RepID=UPI001181F840|nr:ATP-binding protein [Faecalibacterium sp. An58]